ncbi:hypothetical protein FHX14_006663 [Rhizobium sp. BK619]|nr:hypothetical protein [Rhizobium sp. BK619]
MTTGSKLLTSSTERSGFSGLSAARSIFSRLPGRDSGRMKKGKQQFGAIEHGRRDKGQPQPIIAKQTAGDRADDEAEAEHRIEKPKAAGAFLLGRNVGDIGCGDRNIGAGQPGDRPADEQQRETGRKGQEQIVDGGTGERNQQHGAAAEPIAQRPEHRREDELHHRIERGHRADNGRNVFGMGNVAQQRRQDRENQPDADGIEDNGGKDDDKGSGHGCVPGRRKPAGPSAPP